jgi:hypothetical protein
VFASTRRSKISNISCIGRLFEFFKAIASRSRELTGFAPPAAEDGTLQISFAIRPSGTLAFNPTWQIQAHLFLFVLSGRPTLLRARQLYCFAYRCIQPV